MSKAEMKAGYALAKERWKLLYRLERIIEGPMVFLGFLWLTIMIIELTHGLSDRLQLISTGIWVLFILEFLLRFFLAPAKLRFLKKSWFSIISLAIPGLRFFRLFRFLRVLRIYRGFRLVRIISSVNRSMRSLSATMERRGFGYVVILTIAVAFAGAAGMHAFEKGYGNYVTYWDALWWTMMIIISMGTDMWPETAEGRILCFLLALYGFAVFGYITATLASFFVGRDAEEKDAPLAGSAELDLLRKEILKLQELLKRNTDETGMN